MAWFVRFLMLLTAAVTWPIGERRARLAVLRGGPLLGHCGLRPPGQLCGSGGACYLLAAVVPRALSPPHPAQPLPTARPNCPPQLPLAGKLLDWVLGEESALFKRRELKALVSIHAEPEVGHAAAPLPVHFSIAHGVAVYSSCAFLGSMCCGEHLPPDTAW